MSREEERGVGEEEGGTSPPRPLHTKLWKRNGPWNRQVPTPPPIWARPRVQMDCVPPLMEVSPLVMLPRPEPVIRDSAKGKLMNARVSSCDNPKQR